MTETGTETTPAAATATEKTANRWWIGAAIVVGVPLLILSRVSNAARFGDGFLSHWYGQVAAGCVVLAGYTLVHAMVARAHRRRRAADTTDTTDGADGADGADTNAAADTDGRRRAGGDR